MLDLFATLEQVKQVAVATGRLQQENLGRQRLAVTAKSSAIDLVTEIDKRSEQAIIACIRQHFPGHAILAEESGRTAGQSEYLWVIDPLDGTTNYAQGLPIFAVSIALQHRGQTVLGVVFAPEVDQLFTAVKGHGAQLNGTAIAVSTKQELIDSVLATGFPYDIATNPANNLDYFNSLVLKARAVRRMGAAAYDLACVAAGKFDGYWELNLSPWDVAAACLMVEEAGGTVRPFRQDRGISIIAGNAAICDKIAREIQAVDRAREDGRNR
jgi:myo-inositol-1(or 4)-monophosphatase